MTKKNEFEDKFAVLSSVEEKLNGIYSDLVDAKELSPYKAELYSNKLGIVIDYFNNYIAKLNEFNKNTRRKNKRRALILLLIQLLSLPLVFVHPFIPFIVNTIIMIVNSVKIKKTPDTDMTFFKEEVKELKTVAENCLTILRAKAKRREERLEKEYQSSPNIVNEFVIANVTR